MDAATVFSRTLGIEVPLICGAMYPCSNPELVAAVSAAGGIGIVQPLSLTYVHGYDFREGLRYIRRLTDRPIGVNLIVERIPGTCATMAGDCPGGAGAVSGHCPGQSTLGGGPGRTGRGDGLP